MTEPNLTTAFAECVLAEVRWPCRSMCRLEEPRVLFDYYNIIVMTRPSITGRKLNTVWFMPRDNFMVVQFSGRPQTPTNSTSKVYELADPEAVSEVARTVWRRLFWPMANSAVLYASFFSNGYAVYSGLSAGNVVVPALNLLWVITCTSYCLGTYLAWWLTWACSSERRFYRARGSR